MRVLAIIVVSSIVACGESSVTADTAQDAVDTQAPDVADDTDFSPETDVSPDADVGPDAWDRAASRLAVVQMAQYANTGRTTIGGALWAGPAPETYELEDDTGICRLSSGENYFCDPTCVDAVCTSPDPNDECTPYPAMLSAGNLVVSGAGEEVSIKASLDGYSYEAEGLLWQPGDELTFSAAGDEVPAFSTALRMVEPMIGKDLDKLDLKKPLVIEWQPPTVSGDEQRVNIKLQADRGQHGRAYSAVIECDVPDTGRFELPAALQEKYVAEDLWGCGKCPQSILTRYVRTRVASGSYMIDVSVESQQLFLLTPWTTPAE